MRGKQTMFFAVLEDVEKILQDIEAVVGIRYYRAGLLDSKDIPAYTSIFDTPNLGVALSGDWNRIDTYMILKKAIPLYVEEVPQKKGGLKFAVDQMCNPASIELKIGGIYPEIEHVIVAGRVATISDDPDSNELYKLFSARIKKAFKRIGAFYVGKVAEEKLKSGWRLVTNEKSPKEYDLALE